MIKKIAETYLPTKYGDFKLRLYHDTREKKDHMALIFGDLSKNINKPTIVRVHSACATGDIFGSRRCDCRDQLDRSFLTIKKAKRGILIYLNQEGRGIGLANKIKTYELQDKGMDTVEANARLGFAADHRNYHAASVILKDLKIKSIILLTNNPQKINDLSKEKIKVTRCPFWTNKNRHNAYYIKTKKLKMGHLI